MTGTAPPAVPRGPWRTGPAAAAAAVLVVAALGLQAARARYAAAPAGADDALYLRSAPAVGRLVLSFDALAADLYWIRAIQHYGGTRLSPTADKTYPRLYPLLDLTTGLDPRFSIAYRFGAIFLAESPPDGPGRPDWSLALLEKGLAANPDQWQFAMDIGFVHYWWRQDYPQAAAWFERAAAMPGGSWWLRSLAATTLAEGGDRRSSRRMWQQILETADHAWLQNNARLKLAQLEALDRLEVVAAAIARYRAMAGGPPASWQALVSAGLLRGVPADPSGTPFVLDPAAPAGATLSHESPLFPLPPQFTRKGSTVP